MIQIFKEVVYDSQGTTAEKEGDGLRVKHIVFENGEAVQHTYLVHAQGKGKLRDAVLDGLEVARAMPTDDDPNAGAAHR